MSNVHPTMQQFLWFAPAAPVPARPAPINRSVEWVAVNDYMPDDEIAVLVYSGGEVLAGYHDSRFGWMYVGDSSYLSNVTHWAHMPEGPEAT